MAQQNPIALIAPRDWRDHAHALVAECGLPTVHGDWPEALATIRRAQPAAVVVFQAGGHRSAFEQLVPEVERLSPYVPLLVADLDDSCFVDAIGCNTTDGSVVARLRALMRVRALHATVLRRSAVLLPETDPMDDASVLLVGRGSQFPALSVALGERMEVIGALSIEAAAKQLNLRDLDGIVIADGLSERVVDAFLTVLGEDTRFRNLPVVMTSAQPKLTPTLPFFEQTDGDAALVAAKISPLIRYQAFAARLARTLRSIDADGTLDPRSGLMHQPAFQRDLVKLVDSSASSGKLTVARLVLDAGNQRLAWSAARVISRLMRQTDFGTLQDDGSIVIAFPETEWREAQAVAKRFCGVITHTVQGGRRTQRIWPSTTCVALQSNETATALLQRLERAAPGTAVVT